MRGELSVTGTISIVKQWTIDSLIELISVEIQVFLHARHICGADVGLIEVPAVWS